MNEPLSPRAREIIRAAMAAETPPAAPQRARVKRGVLAAALAPSIAAAASGAEGGALRAAAAKSTLGLALGSWGAKATAAVVIAIGAAIAATQAPSVEKSHQPGLAASPAPHSVPQQLGNDPGAAAPSPAGSNVRISSAAPSERPPNGIRGLPSPDPAPNRTTVRGTRAENVTDRPTADAAPTGDRGTAPSMHGQQLRAELAALERVQAQLRAGRGDAALALLDAQTGEGTLLAEERLASEVFAACQAGQEERARRAAGAFLARAPRSLLADRVRHSCAFATEGDEPTGISQH
ncbi:MAG: hypothetical protein JW751_03005 [Polyangiaceae bacterium]|nr:hypothetical protein [Polyangiaceae bacterium]